MTFWDFVNANAEDLIFLATMALVLVATVAISYIMAKYL